MAEYNTRDRSKLFKSGLVDTSDIKDSAVTLDKLAPEVVAEYANKEYVDSAISNVIDLAPGTLDTLNELAAAIGDDANFITTVNDSIATKLASADFDSTFDTRLATKSTDDVAEGSNLYYTDARARASVSASDGITYNSGTGAFSITNTGVTAGTYGSASLVPVIAVNDNGQITSASTVSVAGVSDFSYTSATNTFTIDTADGGSFSATGDLTSFDTGDLVEGSNLYYTEARVDANIAAKTTDDLTEGSNLYYTDARAQGAISTSGPLLSYGSGIVGLTEESIQDVVGAMVASNTESGIAVTYNDSGNVLDFSVDTNTIATRTYVDSAIATVIDTAPAALDTLNELAAAINDDANYAATVTTALSNKADKSTTVTAGTGLTGGGTLASGFTISHADTSSQTSVDNSGNTFIQDITLDGFGHITGIASGTVSIGDGAMTVTAGSGLSGGGQLGTANQSGASSVTISHADTSSQASVDNSNGTVIQDITLDTYGHITAIGSVDLDGRYYTETEADSRFVNVTGDTMSGVLSFSTNVGNKVDFYYSGEDRYGIQVQSSELRIHSGAGGDASGGITFGKSTSSSFSEYMRVLNSGYVNATNSFRAPIFYDSNDTGYYVDPNGTSNLVGLTVSNTISGNISGSAASSGWSTYSQIQDTRSAQLSPDSYQDYRTTYEFTNQITGLGDWHTAMTMQGWHNGYSAWQIIGPASTSAHENWYLRSGVNTSWNTLRSILHSGNYSNYALPLTGGTVSGFLGVGNSVGSNDGSWNARLNVGGSQHARLDVISQSDGIITTIYSHTGQGVGKIGTMSNHPLALIAEGSNIGGYVYNGSIRSPIFYDSNDTNYYVDPNSFSKVARAQVNWGTSNSTAGPALRVSKGWDGGIGNYTYDTVVVESNDVATIRVGEADGTQGGMCWGDGYNTYTSTHPMRFYTNGTAGNNIYSGMSGTLGLYVTAGSARSPIFYDYDNTAYYGDFASVSSVNTLILSGPIRRSAHASGFLEGSYNNVGGNDAKSNPIYTIGSSYNPTDTALSNMYGVGYSNTSFFGSDKGGGWGFYVASAGNIRGVFGAEGGAMNTWINGYGYATDSWRAPIFYDANNTSYYIDASDVSRVNRIRPSSIAHADGVRFSLPDGGAYTTSSSTVTGAIRIALPAALNNSSTMLSFTVHIYQYSTGRSHTFRIGGYNYGGGSWYNPFAINLSGGGDAYTVRFGTDGSRDMVWIGETNSSWSYPQVFVTDVQCGYSGFSDSWDRDWQISFQTSFNSVETSYQPPLLGNTIAVTGNITAYYSDGRLKDFHGKIPDAINKVKKLNGYYFTENEEAKKLGYDNDKMQVGVCAQEVQEVLPEIVVPAPINDKYITIHYDKLTPLLIEAIKEQQEIIEELKKDNSDMKQSINTLLDKVSKLLGE